MRTVLGGVPIKRIMVFWRLHWGRLFWGNSNLGFRVYTSGRLQNLLSGPTVG